MLTFAEALLARLTDRTRAAAMMGDLNELAAIRGRGWFVAAYVRTLFSLTWRIGLALFAAVLCRQAIFDAFHFYLRHTPIAWRSTSSLYGNILNASGPGMAMIVSTLWFMLPYSAVLYGFRDRFVRLAFVMCMGTTIAFLFVPGASAIFGGATLMLAAAAIKSKLWRGPFGILAGTVAAGVLSFAGWGFLRAHVPWSGPRTVLTNSVEIIAFQTALLVIAVVCSRLHRRLLGGGAAVAE